METHCRTHVAHRFARQFTGLASLPAFSGVMLGYVLPLTLITLVVSFVRHGARPQP